METNLSNPNPELKKFFQNQTFRWILSLVFAILLISFVFWVAGVPLEDFWKALSEAGWMALIAVVLIMVSQLVFQAISWKILMRGSQESVPFWGALWAILTGWAGNFITPSMYLGGEPLRAYVLSVRSEISFGRALASVLVHKFLELTSFVFFLLSSSLLVFWFYYHHLSVPVQVAVVFCLAVITLFFVLLLFAFVRRKRFFSGMARFLARKGIAPSFWKRYLKKILKMENEIYKSISTNLFWSFASLGVMVLFHLTIFIRPFFFFVFLGYFLKIQELALIFLLVQLIQAIQLTPGGLGILEGGTIGIFAILHIGPPQALGYATFCRVGDGILVGSGILFLFLCGAQGDLFGVPKMIEEKDLSG